MYNESSELRLKIDNKIDLRNIAIILFFSRTAIVDFFSILGVPKPTMALIISGICYLFFFISMFFYKKSIKLDSVLIILGTMLFFKMTLNAHPEYYNVYFSEEFDIYQNIFNGFSMVFAYMFIRMQVNLDNLITSFKYIGFINFLGTFWQIVYKDGADYGMRFGYTLSFTAIIFLFFYFTEKKYRFLVISLISIFLALIGGSRGTIIGYLCFFVLYLLFVGKVNITYKKIFSSLFFVFCLVLIISKDFQFFIYNLLTALGFKSRILEMFINGDALNSNGRDAIYYRLNQYIDGLGWGDYLGAYSDRYIMRGRFYSHNILIELTLTFGKIVTVIIIILFFFSLIRIAIKYWRTKYFGFLLVLASFSICRLWVSSSFWVEPILGACFAFMVNLIVQAQGVKKNEKY